MEQSYRLVVECPNDIAIDMSLAMQHSDSRELSKAKRQYLLTLQVNRYCLLSMHGSVVIHILNRMFGKLLNGAVSSPSQQADHIHITQFL